jgi:hypothetical protein
MIALSWVSWRLRFWAELTGRCADAGKNETSMTPSITAVVMSLQ